MNFVNATLVASGDGLGVRLADGTVLMLPAARTARLGERRDQAIILGVRPEHLSRAVQNDSRTGLARCSANIDLLLPTGSRTYATFKLGGTEVTAELQAHDVTQINQRIELSIDMNRAVIIDPETEKVL
jgi:multiple sugar transport system ATP-binding protein